MKEEAKAERARQKTLKETKTKINDDSDKSGEDSDDYGEKSDAESQEPDSDNDDKESEPEDDQEDEDTEEEPEESEEDEEENEDEDESGSGSGSDYGSSSGSGSYYKSSSEDRSKSGSGSSSGSGYGSGDDREYSGDMFKKNPVTYALLERQWDGVKNDVNDTIEFCAISKWRIGGEHQRYSRLGDVLIPYPPLKQDRRFYASHTCNSIYFLSKKDGDFKLIVVTLDLKAYVYSLGKMPGNQELKNLEGTSLHGNRVLCIETTYDKNHKKLPKGQSRFIFWDLQLHKEQWEYANVEAVFFKSKKEKLPYRGSDYDKDEYMIVQLCMYRGMDDDYLGYLTQQRTSIFITSSEIAQATERDIKGFYKERDEEFKMPKHIYVLKSNFEEVTITVKDKEEEKRKKEEERLKAEAEKFAKGKHSDSDSEDDKFNQKRDAAKSVF